MSLLSRLPGRTGSSRFESVDSLAAELRGSLKRLPAGSPVAVPAEAELAGLQAAGPAPIAPGATNWSASYRRGFLAGHLIGTLIRSGRPVTDRTVAVAAAYAAVLASEDLRSHLDGSTPDTVAGIHTRAWLQAEGDPDPVHADVRHAAMHWLEEGLGVASSPGPRAANELWWQARDGSIIPGAEPGKPTKVGARVAPFGTLSIERSGRVDISMAFLIAEESWQAAAEHRVQPASDPLTDPALNGMFELCVGEASLFRAESASIASIACQLARARASGFPEANQTCTVEGPAGGWCLVFMHDPAARQITITETNSGATGHAGAAVVATMMGLFARTFATRAARHIPDMTNWGGLAVLGGLLAEDLTPVRMVLRSTPRV